MSSKKPIAVALILAGVLACGAARASTDVHWTVTIGSPVGVPVYESAPVVVRAAPVYVQPAPVYQYRAPQYARWDRDGDGIPNHRDRLYNPRWDRDGDGVPNRRDHYDNRRHDRDGDGIPNWQDRHDGRSGWRR
jgi:hypothetical protein